MQTDHHRDRDDKPFDLGTALGDWTVSDAHELYKFPRWSGGYFGINQEGNVTVEPEGQKGLSIDLMKVVEEIKQKGVGLPVLIRFQDVLRSRVVELNETFRELLKEYDYNGRYYGVYPVKVNQMREVVEEVVDAGSPYHYGLEAGSKAEIIPVLAFNTDPEALTVCNGYKDNEFLRLALIGRKLGRKVIIVIEKLSELQRVIDLAKEMKVEPYVGIRAKLSARSAGKWESSSGDQAKFGLSVPEILQAASTLKANGLEKSLKLFHFHIGSQIPDIRRIKSAVREGARIYSKLVKLGFPLEYLDVGGGLGIDYGASSYGHPSSTNYSLREYVSDVVYNVKQICDNEEIKHPHIVTESGRAITAHHSLLVMDVFGKIDKRGDIALSKSFLKDDELTMEGENAIKEMEYLLKELSTENAVEFFHDAVAKKEEIQSAFTHGIVSLAERGRVESLFWGFCYQLTAVIPLMEYVPEELKAIDEKLGSQYLGNFSLFQTAPDHWALNQIFPVVPIHKLDQKPREKAAIVDITCDSDGKIKEYLNGATRSTTVRLHELDENPYYIGLFLLGAYQDVMGDMHNCYGRVNEVHVFVDEDDESGFYVEEVLKGQSISQVLSEHQYSPIELVRLLKSAIDKKTKEGKIKPREGVHYVDFLEEVLSGYTYLNDLKEVKGEQNGKF